MRQQTSSSERIGRPAGCSAERVKRRETFRQGEFRAGGLSLGRRPAANGRGRRCCSCCCFGAPSGESRSRAKSEQASEKLSPDLSWARSGGEDTLHPPGGGQKKKAAAIARGRSEQGFRWAPCRGGKLARRLRGER